MPLVNGNEMSPDDAMAKGLCPECGQDLTKSNPIAHRASHWKKSPPHDKRGDEPRRRMALFDKFILDNKVRTTDMPKPAGAAAAPLP